MILPSPLHVLPLPPHHHFLSPYFAFLLSFSIIVWGPYLHSTLITIPPISYLFLISHISLLSPVYLISISYLSAIYLLSISYLSLLSIVYLLSRIFTQFSFLSVSFLLLSLDHASFFSFLFPFLHLQYRLLSFLLCFFSLL